MSMLDQNIISVRIVKHPRQPQRCEVDDGAAGGRWSHPIGQDLHVRTTRTDFYGRLFNTWHCPRHAVAFYYDRHGEQLIESAFAAYAERQQREVPA